MARTIEFGEEPGDRTVHEDGAEYRQEQVSDDLAIVESQASERAERAALNLKLRGASYAEIARTLEYTSPAHARSVVEGALAKTAGTEDASSIRQISSLRLEELYRHVVPMTRPVVERRDANGKLVREKGEVVFDVNDQQVPFVKLAVDIIDRQNKLHGANAPQQLTITPDTATVNELVRRLRADQMTNVAPSGDPFAEEVVDAVVIDDEDQPLG